jgi:Lrp/AsnC family leucine-responsive transcriptional regulator
MDNIDIKILDQLKENARVSASEIGEKVNMSVSAVIERIKKMENSGIIKQYTLILDSKLINQDVSAFISISLDHPKYNESFIASVLDHKRIVECHYITGDSDFLLKVVIDSTGSLEKVLNDIKSIQGVSMTRTLVVLSTVKNEYTVLPDNL